MFTLVAAFCSLGAPHRLFLGAIMVLANCVVAAAQTRTVVDGYTPLGLAPGAPVGSYELSGFENVNPYNGGLNFSLPIKQVAGRGGASYTLQVPIENKWIAEVDDFCEPQTGQCWHFESPIFYGGGDGALPILTALTALECSSVEGQGSAFNRKVSAVTITKIHTGKQSRG